MKVWSNWKDYPAADWKQRWPNFSPQEMACRGTGKLAVNERAMDMLQSLRTAAGKPFIIRSAYRSPEHNKRVGGAKASKHMEAIAFDIDMTNHVPDEFIAAAQAAGFMGIGTYPGSNFLHIDARPAPARWGKPFPPRQNRFAVETKPVEESKPKEKAALVGALGGMGVGGAADLLLTGGDTIEKVGAAPLPVQLIIGGVVLLVTAGLVWRYAVGAKG